MLIKALCDYYDALEKKEKVLPEGFSNAKIHYLISLAPDGKIDDIINWQKTEKVEAGKGKIKERFVPRTAKLPERTEKSGIDANIIEHRPLYIFGLNFEKDHFAPEDRTGKAQKSHEAFVNKNLEFLEGLTSPVIDAYRNFIISWKPEEEVENLFLVNLGKAYSASGFAFCLAGRPDLLLHEEPQILERWESWKKQQDLEKGEAAVSQCAITGKTAPIARIHNKIKGVYGGLATGSVLIGFNNPSESSYGNDQSYNSNISRSAMKKYSEALNYLLASRRHKVMLDDTTVVFWASGDQEECSDLLAALLFEKPEVMNAERTEQMLYDLMQDAREGTLADGRLDVLDKIDKNVDFYMVGMKPNSSRLAIKFLYHKRFGDILQNIVQHQIDLRVSETSKPISFWMIGKSLVSPKSKNEVLDVALMTKILEAAVYGTSYPEFMLDMAVRREKVGGEGNTGRVHAGIIKAYLNRKKRLQGEKEEFTLALNKENQNPAYLCGRLFAVLEKLQQDASEGALNRTIKDSYFASAAAKPAFIFPKLIILAQNHLGKLKNPGRVFYYNALLQEIIGKIDREFPDTFLTKEQGTFMIGYYQQCENFYAKKANKAEEE